ncbi:hypothetical protein M197_gp55 [Haloarcula hispanica tailed virus 2]|uniref:Uncharacterized protein n=1 Tax=Haloarcula hispanica tailed virus 2 TaxID=1273751 RepID=R4T8K5_9CAUD|nr:hypothetical protein M197_gp55 [Haloarcula hispanica tailed virus 2]AGM11220.1 hypothetical protein HHTV2_55 [Haloarcula hispanica tailed virus 2]
MSSTFDPAEAARRTRLTSAHGRSPECEDDRCPGAWPEDGESLPCWPCYRDRDLLPVPVRNDAGP